MIRIPFSRWLLFPLILFILSLGYVILKNDWIYLSPWIGAALIALAVIFVFSPQLDWWWWSIFTPRPDTKILQLIADKRPAYNHLDAERLKLFHKRLFLFIQGKDFTFMDMDSEPEDIKAITATYPILLTLHQRSFLMDPYDKIVFFRKRFSSPEQQKPHASERHREDKVLIFSIENLAAGFAGGSVSPDFGLYEFVSLYWELYGIPKQPWPPIDWTIAEKMGMWTPSKLEHDYGLVNVHQQALMLCNAEAFTDIFKQQFPDWDLFFQENLPYYSLIKVPFS